jgi:hypothetical protein
MKSSAKYTLVTVAAVFAMCASVMAGTPALVNERSNFAGPVSKPSIIQSACLKCHGGKSVNGDLDFTQGLTREQKLDAIAKVARGEMPKNGPKLTPQQFSHLKKELGMTTAGASSAPNQGPPTSPLAKRSAPNSRSSKAITPASSNASTLTSAPQAHVSVIPASDSVPTARVQVLPPGANKSFAGTARARQIAKPTPPKPRLKNILPAGLPKEDTNSQADLSDAANEGA